MAQTKIPAGLLDKSSHVDFADNEKLRLGTGNDLQIYHDGSNSHIKDTGTGDLLIEGSDNIWLMQSGGAKVFLNTIDSSAVNLYFNNSKKLETTNTGALVTGNLAVSGNLTVSGTTTELDTTNLNVTDKNITLNYHASSDTSSSADGAGITIQDAVNGSTDATILWNATSDQFDFSHHIKVPDSKYLKMGNDNDFIIYHDGTTNYIQAVKEDSDIRFRGNDGGTNFNAMVIDMSAAGKVGIGIDTPTAMLDVRRGDASGKVAEFHNNTGYGIDIGSDSNAVAYISSGYNQAFAFKTDAGSGQVERMRIDSSGNVGIATTAKKNGYPARFTTTSLSTPASEEACHILELVGNRTTNAGNQNGMIQFWNNTSTAAEVGRISSIQGTAVNSGAFTFATYNAGSSIEAMRIVQDGSIGIGELNPDRTFHVKSGTTNVVAKFESTDSIAAIEFTDSGGSAEIGCDGSDVVLFPAGAEKFRVNTSGNIIAQSASQNRIVLGSTGNSSNNTSNWMRGNAGYLQFNSASSGYNWEINGSNKMSMNASGDLTTQAITAVANGNYSSGTVPLIAKSVSNRGTVRIRSDGDNPAELFFDVNGGIRWDFSSRASASNYDMLMYPQHSTPSLTAVAAHVFRFTQTGHLGIGTNTSARSGLDVQGAITMENADTDLLTHSYSSYASRVNSGRLDITTGYSGTLAAGRVFRFKYNAVSWKAFHGRITLSGTGGFSSYEFGGYWNNSGSSQIKEIQNGISTSAAFTTSGQAILISITLGQTVVHPCFSLEYNQSGGDGPPRMDRAEVFIQ